MTGSRYTRQQLFMLRNNIPIDGLIEQLAIPSKQMEGYFRFCCPVCREFNTGVNPKTNLARCFRCNKNYNTIDLVMVVNGLNFLRSVEFLKTYHDGKEKPVSSTPLPIERTACVQPVAIADIFRTITNKEKVNSKTQQTHNSPSINQLYERITQLEKKVESLTQKSK